MEVITFTHIVGRLALSTLLKLRGLRVAGFWTWLATLGAEVSLSESYPFMPQE